MPHGLMAWVSGSEPPEQAGKQAEGEAGETWEELPTAGDKNTPCSPEGE